MTRGTRCYLDNRQRDVQRHSYVTSHIGRPGASFRIKPATRNHSVSLLHVSLHVRRILRIRSRSVLLHVRHLNTNSLLFLLFAHSVLRFWFTHKATFLVKKEMWLYSKERTKLPPMKRFLHLNDSICCRMSSRSQQTLSTRMKLAHLLRHVDHLLHQSGPTAHSPIAHLTLRPFPAPCRSAASSPPPPRPSSRTAPSSSPGMRQSPPASSESR